MLGGKFNLGSLMKNAKKMQEMMQKAQEELAKVEVIGESGAGSVKVVMNAKHYVKRIEVDPSLLQEDKAVLEDLIAAAFNDAANKVEEITKAKMAGFGEMFGGMSGDDK